MADQKSVFQPVQPQDLQGPFSEALIPTPPREVNLPPGKLSPLGAIAMIGTAFTQEASRQRAIGAYRRENEKAGKLAQLNAYIQRIVQDPNLTDDAKQFATREYSKALGGEILGAAEGGGKGKGGKKGGKGGEPQGAGQHFTNILKDIATGMVGGKMPKGMADIDLHSVMGRIDAEVYQDKYNIEKVNAEYANRMEGLVGRLDPGAPPESILAKPESRQLFQEWSAKYPQQAKTWMESVLLAHPAQPSVAAETQSLSRWGGAQPPQVEGPGSQPPQGAPPSVSKGPEYTGRTLTGDQLRIANSQGRIHQEGDWQLPDGTRIQGRLIDMPEGVTFVDASGRELKVDVARLTPYAERAPVNLIDPKTKAMKRALQEKGTGKLYDADTGERLPSEQQSWAQVTPSAAAARDRFTGKQTREGYPIMQSTDGSLYIDDSIMMPKPVDYVGARISEARDKEYRDGLKGLLKDETDTTNRINGPWDSKDAAVNKDIAMNAEAKKAALADNKRQRQEALDMAKAQFDRNRELLRRAYEDVASGAKKPAAAPASSGVPAKTRKLFP